MSVTFPDSAAVPTEDRASWLAARSRGIGGSDVSAILGLNRWSSPLDVWLQKTGRAKEKVATWPMWRGSALESPLLDWFTAHNEHGVTVDRPIPMQRSVSQPWMLANLDGHTSDGGVAECKTASWWMREEWEDGQVSDHAELQSQWYMSVTGLGHAWVISAVGDDDPTWVRVPRNDALIGTMVDACGRFWRDNVLADREPPAVAIDLPELNKRRSEPGTLYFGTATDDADLIAYTRLSETIKDAKARRDDVQARLLQSIGESETVVIDGQIAATRKTFEKAGYTVEYKPRTETRLTVPAKRKTWKESA